MVYLSSAHRARMAALSRPRSDNRNVMVLPGLGKTTNFREEGYGKPAYVPSKLKNDEIGAGFFEKNLTWSRLTG